VLLLVVVIVKVIVIEAANDLSNDTISRMTAVTSYNHINSNSIM